MAVAIPFPQKIEQVTESLTELEGKFIYICFTNKVKENILKQMQTALLANCSESLKVSHALGLQQAVSQNPSTWLSFLCVHDLIVMEHAAKDILKRFLLPLSSVKTSPLD